MVKNSKFIVVFAAIGFVLSFVFALTSHSSILMVLLKALITCISFGVLGFLISFVFNKFLGEEISPDNISDSDGERVQSGSQGKGQVVDLVIADEELQKGESGNHFIVSNSQMLNSTDVSSKNEKLFEKKTEEPERTEKSVDDKFVPLKEKETVTNFSSNESIGAASAVSNTAVESSGEVDVLPDMASISMVSEESHGNDDSDDDVSFSSDSDSSFSSPKKSSGSSEFQGDINNTELIAKAISSVLSAENE